ncbi:hypothetical protein [Lichenibacterium ramalinae]|uniref:Uncharacterized protein n=1 Tax=Lichenibacterium ramalinae TaxID=2316527 RepID=A0A4Q2R746_9HYPH|nr:hypothetical protein [Lichenibacterium ramalinae]RYB01509.1 hypothetical protein D3272_25815 [Lichenibacterium ramalinae]
MVEVDPAEAPAVLKRHNLLVAGRRGDITPTEAEAEVLASGLEPFASEWQHERDMTAHSTWWLPVAVLFYAWQDLPATRREYERFVVWGRALWRDTKQAGMRLSLDEAESKVREDLVAGLLRGFGTDADRQLVPIAREEWRELRFAHDASLAASRADGTLVYSGVFVLRHEVVPLWMQEFATAGAAVQSVARERVDQPPPKRAGGRPATHDWACAAGFAAAFILDNDYPAVEGDLTSVVTSWFAEERGKAPDPRDVQRFVAEIYKHRRPTPAE